MKSISLFVSLLLIMTTHSSATTGKDADSTSTDITIKETEEYVPLIALGRVKKRKTLGFSLGGNLNFLVGRPKSYFVLASEHTMFQMGANFGLHWEIFKTNVRLSVEGSFLFAESHEPWLFDNHSNANINFHYLIKKEHYLIYPELGIGTSGYYTHLQHTNPILLNLGLGIEHNIGQNARTYVACRTQTDVHWTGLVMFSIHFGLRLNVV